MPESDRRSRLKAARLQRSSFTKDVPLLGPSRPSVKLGARLESPSGGRHVDAEVFQEMQSLDDVKRRQLKLAAAETFDRLARTASHRLSEQELLRRKWGARCVEQHVLRQGIRICARRRRAAEQKDGIILSKCADLLSTWLNTKTPEARAPCEEVAKDVALFQQEMLCLQQHLPRVPSHLPVEGFESAREAWTASLRPRAAALRMQIGTECCERLRRREPEDIEDSADRPDVHPGPLKHLWQEDAEHLSEFEAEDTQDMDARVAAAMEVLDVHEPKALKVRMAGLKHSAIRDEDTFKQLIAEKFAEAINLDTDQVRVRSFGEAK